GQNCAAHRRGMGSLSERQDEDFRRIWAVLRSNEAQPGDQFVWRAVLAAVLLRSGYAEHCFDSACVWQQRALLRRPGFDKPGEFRRRYARRANLPGKPKFSY